MLIPYLKLTARKDSTVDQTVYLTGQTHVRMKLIELGGKYGSVIGNYAQVDDEDYEELNKYKWHAVNHKGLYYAARNRKHSDLCIDK